jgi:hypothetical protein
LTLPPEIKILSDFLYRLYRLLLLPLQSRPLSFENSTMTMSSSFTKGADLNNDTL